MTTSASGAQYCPGILSKLLIWYGLFRRNRVITRVQSKQRHPHRQNSIRARSISVVRRLCRIAPSGTLHSPVELIKVPHLRNLINVYGLVLGDLIGVQAEEGVHAVAHGLEVDFAAEIGAFQGYARDVQVPGVGDDGGCFELAVGAFFT